MATKSTERACDTSAGTRTRLGRRLTAAAIELVTRTAGSLRARASRSETTPNSGPGCSPLVGTATRVGANQLPPGAPSRWRPAGMARRSSDAGRPRRSWYAPRPAAARGDEQVVAAPAEGDARVPRAPGTERSSKRLEAERPRAGARAAHPRRRRLVGHGAGGVQCPFAARGGPPCRRIDVAGHRDHVHGDAGGAREVAGGAGSRSSVTETVPGRSADRTVRKLIEARDRGTGPLLVGVGRRGRVASGAAAARARRRLRRRRVGRATTPRARCVPPIAVGQRRWWARR